MRARLVIAESAVRVEIREVKLRNKPASLLEASAKATVPVLITEGSIIDESFDIMLWALGQNDPQGWMDRMDGDLIAECDGSFKSALDQYKYASRFVETNALEQRAFASTFLRKLDVRLNATPFLSGDMVGMSDMSIITFVRQFANVDIEWFRGEQWPKLIAWLDNSTGSPAFARIMHRYPEWHPDDAPIFFPEES